MKNLLTPHEGTSRYFAGRLLTGGHHYALVSEADSFAKRLVLLGDIEVLATDGKAVTLPDSANDKDLKQIVDDYLVSNPWDGKDGSYVEHIADAYRFAAEAYTSELMGETEESEDEKRKVAADAEAAAKEAAEATAAAEKAAAEKAAAEKAEQEAADKAAAEKAEQEAADKAAAEKALADEAAAAKKEAAAAKKEAADKAAK